MAGGSYETFAYTATSGVAANFSVTTDRTNSSSVINISGTFNGHQITNTSSYDNPSERLADGTDNGIYYVYKGYISDPNSFQNPRNGLSFTLDNGTQVRIYIQTDAAGNHSLAYEESTGSGGPIDFNYTTSYQTVACFAVGTRILTPNGPVPVERLSAGDLVTMQGGEARPVVWTGHTVVRPMRHPKPDDVRPVRIVAGAFAAGVPARDLRLSPGHAIWWEGGFVNACELVNDATVVQEDAERIAYHHVELESHDLLLAEGLPCESYLDDGNRASFADGGGGVVRLHDPIDPAARPRTCAPPCDAAALARLRAHLLGRALALGWRLAEVPELRVHMGGRMLEAVAVAAGRYWFALPEGASQLVIASASVRIDRVQPDAADPRRLGVAIGGLRIDGEPLALAGSGFGQGFHPLETTGDADWRWTNGAAHLRLDPPARMLEIAVRYVAPRLEREDRALGAVAC